MVSGMFMSALSAPSQACSTHEEAERPTWGSAKHCAASCSVDSSSACASSHTVSISLYTPVGRCVYKQAAGEAATNPNPCWTRQMPAEMQSIVGTLLSIHAAPRQPGPHSAGVAEEHCHTTEALEHPSCPSPRT